jgi:hypothetical protein
MGVFCLRRALLSALSTLMTLTPSKGPSAKRDSAEGQGRSPRAKPLLERQSAGVAIKDGFQRAEALQTEAARSRLLAS